MKILALALLIMLGISYAIPSAAQDQSGTILGSERSFIRTTTYQITIQKEIVPGVSEVVGRKYPVNLTQSLSGIFLNENGTLWLQDSVPSKEAQIEEAIGKIEPTVIADIANIEHIKKYGNEATAEQISAYKKYFSEQYGSLYKKIYLGDPKTMNPEKIGENMVIDPSQSNGTVRVSPIKPTSQLASVEVNGYPAIRIEPNASVQKGDIVYAMILDRANGSISEPKIEKTVVKDITPTEVIVNNVSEGIAVLVDEKGRIIGLGNGGRDRVVRGNEIFSELNKSNISNLGGLTTQAYLDGLHQYQAGNNDNALKKFEEVLKVDSQNPGAIYYSNKINDAKNPIENIVKPNWQLFLILIIVIIGGGALLLRMMPGNERKGGRYRRD